MRVIVGIFALALAILLAPQATGAAWEPHHTNTHGTALTPDGRYYAAAVSGEPVRYVKVFDLEAREILRLDLGPGVGKVGDLAISADGTRLAFQLVPAAGRRAADVFSDQNALMVVGVDGQVEALLSAPGRYHGPPGLSWDGSALVFGVADFSVGSRSIPKHPYAYDLETGAFTRLSDQGFERIREIYFAEDGSGVWLRYWRPELPDGSVVGVLDYPPSLADRPAPDRPSFFHTWWRFGDPLPTWSEPVTPWKDSTITNIGADGRAYGQVMLGVSGFTRQMTAYGVVDQDLPPWSLWAASPGEPPAIIESDAMRAPPYPERVGISGSARYDSIRDRFVMIAVRETRRSRPRDRDYGPPFLAIRDASGFREVDTSDWPMRTVEVGFEWPDHLQPVRADAP
ncbi:MAG: hypothetical protein ABL308_13950 [Oceanicaulis sp.]